MGRKQKFEDLSENEVNKLRMKTSTPLQKQDDVLTVDDIIKSDDMMFKVHFMSNMMLLNKTMPEIKAAYLEKFGEEIGNARIYTLKKYVRAVYLAQITTNRDEMIADELMHAEWELGQLKEYWERSKLGKRKISKHKANSVGTEITTYDLDETTENEEDTIGDLNAMKQINEVRNRIIRVLGLEAPKQTPIDQTNKPNAITINIVGQRKDIHVQDVNPEDE